MAEVVDIKDGNTAWYPVDGTTVMQEGSMVHCGVDAADPGTGVITMSAAAGASDTTTTAIPLGIVIGINDVTQVNNTGSGEIPTPEITGTDTQAAQVARTWFGVEGMWSKGDPQPLVEVALVDPSTKIKIPIWGNSTWGTALTVLTSTTASADGLGFTTNATDFTPVKQYQTFYCRTGANAGLYRVSDTTSTTVHTFEKAWPYDVAIGDTFVCAPVRPGFGRMQTDALATYINADATPATDYYSVYYDHIDLRFAGQEHVVFRFSTEQFNPQRA